MHLSTMLYRSHCSMPYFPIRTMSGPGPGPITPYKILQRTLQCTGTRLIVHWCVICSIDTVAQLSVMAKWCEFNALCNWIEILIENGIWKIGFWLLFCCEGETPFGIVADTEDNGLQPPAKDVYPSPSILPKRQLLDAGCMKTIQKSPDLWQRRRWHSTRSIENGKMDRRGVSFEPIALLLDAAVEGELDVVKQCIKQVGLCVCLSM